ncbi:hypothetical protein [Microcoleus sp. Pol17_C1]
MRDENKKRRVCFDRPAVAVEAPGTVPWADRLCWLSLEKWNC